MHIVRGTRICLLGGSLMCQGKIDDAVPGDTGSVSSRTRNGWFKVRIDRTGELIKIRNIYGAIQLYEDYLHYRDAPYIARHFVDKWFNSAVIIADRKM
jgi:hypothetical protein